MEGHMANDNLGIGPRDAETLRPLADEVARISALPVMAERRELWRRLNGLQRPRPLLHIHWTQIPWHEFSGPEHDLRCAGELARHAEGQLRRLVWRHRHCPADDAFEPSVWIVADVDDTGWGLPLRPHRPNERFGAAEYECLIRDFADVEKIRTPTVTPNHELTGAKVAALEEAMGGAVRVEPACGVAPPLWDLLVQWYGTNELMLDIVDRPELVHAAAARLTEVIIGRMKQVEAAGLLRLNNRNQEAGNGGAGYTDELPQRDFVGRVRLRDLWGLQMAQIFVGMSPEMHEEFALRYEVKILEHFGLNGYGCCEPLHHKVHVIRQVPRLRRISMSPWVDWVVGAAAIGTDYVFSAKPNPAFLAGTRWDPQPAAAQLRQILDATRGLNVEIVLKDVHTLANEPQRLVAWHDMARKIMEDYE